MTQRPSRLEATTLHAVFLDASGIRQCDRDEWVGGTGMDVLSAVLDALDIPGSVNETITLDDVPLCMYGTFATKDPGVGQVWFLATRVAEKHVLAIHRMFKPVLEDMHARFPVLLAYTHPRNKLHHLWMERNGFVKSHNIRTRMGISYLAFTRTQGDVPFASPQPSL